MQFGFMHDKGTVDAIFILRRLQEEYHAKGKKVVYVFCWHRESFCLSTKESVVMDNEEENNTRSFA